MEVTEILGWEIDSHCDVLSAKGLKAERLAAPTQSCCFPRVPLSKRADYLDHDMSKYAHRRAASVCCCGGGGGGSLQHVAYTYHSE